MKSSRAAWIAVLLPWITAPWLFPAGTSNAWGGVPVWVIYSLAATVLVAILFSLTAGRVWEGLSDEADVLNGDPRSEEGGES